MTDPLDAFVTLTLFAGASALVFLLGILLT
jgi:hypothetical protein